MTRIAPATWPQVFRWVRPIGKPLLAAAVLFAVALQLRRDLREVDFQKLAFQWQWIGVSVLLYAIGRGLCSWYWYRLLVVVGESPRFLLALRAYWLAELGKYLPGKAWVLLIRANALQGRGVKPGIAVITSFYEVLTMMTSGAVIATLAFCTLALPQLASGVHAAWLACALAAVCAGPLLPPVFNMIVRRLSRRFENVASFKLPPLRALCLIEGVVTMIVVWFCLGLSLWAMIAAVVPAGQPFSMSIWARYTAILALAVVGGFVTIIMPAGMGVREWLLDRFLTPELAALTVAGSPPVAVVVALLLRLAWTLSEVFLAALFWCLPRPRNADAGLSDLAKRRKVAWFKT